MLTLTRAELSTLTLITNTAEYANLHGTAEYANTYTSRAGQVNTYTSRAEYAYTSRAGHANTYTSRAGHANIYTIRAGHVNTYTKNGDGLLHVVLLCANGVNLWDTENVQ